MNSSGALLTADLSVSVVLTSQLIPSPHTKSLLQQEDPQLEVEVLPLEGVDPLAVLPHRPVEISSILIGRAPTLLHSHWSRASECPSMFRVLQPSSIMA